MVDGHKCHPQRPIIYEAEELLRKAVHLADDPFVALSQSYNRKSRDERLSPSFLEDDDER